MSPFNIQIFFGVIIGIVAYIVLYIGKGIQKYAIEGLKVDKTVKSKHSGVWIIGTALTVSFMALHWLPLALLQTPINVIAPLEGIGLVALLIFSAIVLKEKITKLEILAIILIIIGTVLVNVGITEQEELVRELINFNALWIALGVTTSIFLVLYFVAFRKSDIFTGIILGLSAGNYMAFETLTKRITDINSLALAFTFLTFLLAIFALGFTQFALAKTRANIVIPCFTSTSIIITTILGKYVINEAITVIQIVGISVIVIAVILMNLRSPETEEETDLADESSIPVIESDESTLEKSQS